MKILHIHPSLSDGGIESMICHLSNEMVKTSEVTICTIFAPKASDTIKVILNYESDASLADGPFTVKFQDVAFVYSTIDDSSVQPVFLK